MNFFKALIIIGYVLTFIGFSSLLIGETIYENLVKEDGVIEYASALFLLFLSLFLVFRAFADRRKKPSVWFIFQLLLAALFFFGFGEEISWGQRLFNIESSEFFLENNAQKETNLHNLVVNDTKLNKIIFAQGLTLVIGCYFLFSPLLYQKVRWFKDFVNHLSIPIPQWKQTLFFLFITLCVILLKEHRIWEIWELAFVVTLLWVFHSPANKDNHEV